MAGWRISSPAHVIERECGVAAVPFYGLYPAEKRRRETAGRAELPKGMLRVQLLLARAC